MRQGEVWRLLCRVDPDRALAGLLTALEAGEAEPAAWRSFFWAAAESEDPEVHAASLAAAERPDFPAGLVHPLLDWLMRRRDLGAAATTEALLVLWDRLFSELAELASPVDEDIREDPVFQMLNSAEGKIGTLLINEIERRREAGEGPLPAALKQRIERLVASDACAEGAWPRRDDGRPSRAVPSRPGLDDRGPGSAASLGRSGRGRRLLGRAPLVRPARSDAVRFAQVGHAVRRPSAFGRTRQPEPRGLADAALTMGAKAGRGALRPDGDRDPARARRWRRGSADARPLICWSGRWSSSATTRRRSGASEPSR